MHKLKPLLMLILIWLSCEPLFAQVTSGGIVGEVFDSSGAVLANCTITAKDLATGAVRTVQTNDSGYYTLPSLSPDPYELTATAAGFETTSSRITVLLGNTVSFAFHLHVGSTSQNVQVDASASSVELQTSDHQIGNLFNAHSIENLPSSGRDLFNVLQAGANVAPFQNAPGPISNFGATGHSLTIGGSASGTTSYLQDGVSNVSMLTETANLIPSVESVQEVSIIQNGASARFDEPSVVNVITKGGTNTYHGRLYDFLRNDALDTVGYFKVPKPPLRYNQFGANIGGPIVKNKLFFFFDYAGLRQSAGRTSYDNVPTAAERQGNFSQDAYTIYDPTTYNQKTGTVSAFPNNIIPQSRISGFAQKFMQYYPSPTPSAVANTNFQVNIADTTTYNSYLGRIDYNIGFHDSVYGAYESSNPYNRQPSFSGSSIFDYINIQTAKNAYVQETHIFNSNLLNIGRFGYNASNILNTTQGTGTQNFASMFGLQNLNPLPSQYSPPAVTLKGHTGLGSATSPQGAIQDLYEFADELNLTRGKHYIYVGGELDKLNINGNWVYANNGQYTFTGQYTSNHNVKSLVGGSDLADLLLGVPTSAQGGTGVTVADFRQWNVLPYIQDDWRVSSKLTLNLGLRYDYYGSPNDANGHSNVYDVYTNTNHKGTFHQNYLNFAPRVGFAYSLNDSMVIHGGYGIYYAPFSYNQLQFLMINEPNFYLQNYTYPLNTLTPVTNTFVANPTLSAEAPFTIALHMPTPYVQQWNLAVQRSLGSQWLATVSYLGNKSTHLQIRQNPNQAALPSNPSNPTPIQSRRPYSYVGDVFQIADIASGNYNGVEADLERRFSSGLSLLGNYVWSKSMDTTNNGAEVPEYGPDVQAEYGLSDFNSSQVFKVSGVYEFPLGVGKAYFGSKNWFNTHVIGGWQGSGIFTVRSGLPFNVSATDLSNTGAYHAQRANQVCNGKRLRQQSIHLWFDTTCYVQPSIGQLGNEQRDNIIGPRQTNLDLSLLKNFSIMATRFLQFRTDVFDAFNHPLLGNPSAAVGTPTYGQITSIGGVRAIQLSAKIIY